MAIDVWIQHPTLRLLRHEAFESLRRWTGQQIPTEEVPLETTLAAMDAAHIELGLVSAWHAPEGPLISNDEVARFVAAAPRRLAPAPCGSKVLFGSNYPMISPQHALADLDKLGLDAEARELFLTGNARRVFGLP